MKDGSEVALSQLLEQFGQYILGKDITEEFGNQLPLLVKFIDARENLSVQVHPTDEDARELSETDTGKTEAWVILEAGENAVVYLDFRDDADPADFQKAVIAADTSIAQDYLRAVPVKSGDIFLCPAGTIHAIGKDVLLVEIEQNSDLTYRVWDWNREPRRPLHLEKAMKVLNFGNQTENTFCQSPRRISETEEQLIDSLYFTMNRLQLGPSQEIVTNTKGGFQILTCLEGSVMLQCNEAIEHLGRGQSLLVPAGLGQYNISTHEEAVLLKFFVATRQSIDPVIFQTYDINRGED